ncbi:MAG TPA: porin family protein [Ferruginibacter sp.]|nr:porin family protein [Ferruginibacter sp.]HMP22415.1 porin family protein [Ferruginibacter sp.]
MKKILFACLLFVTGGAYSQSYQLGIKGGANISNFTGGNFSEVEKSALVGFYGGAFVSFGVGSNFFIQPEALVSTQGAKFKDEGVTDKYKLTYVTVPVMLKYKSDGGFFAEAGPQVGFKIGENVGDESIKDFFKNLDLSAGLGLGYQSKSGFGANLRYLIGLTKLGNFDPSLGNTNFKNSVIQIGIFFALGGSGGK